MAKGTLLTNFVDDILNAAMNGKRRYNLIPNDDGTYSLEDVTTYDQIGTDFGAAIVNAIANAVNESADKNKVIDDIDTINGLTEEGYIAGGLALKAVTNSLGIKLSYAGNTNSKIDLRHSISAQTVTELEPNKSVDIEIDISEYNYKSLIYAIPQIYNITLRIAYKYTLSNAQKAVFAVINNGTNNYTGGIYPDILFIGTV